MLILTSDTIADNSDTLSASWPGPRVLILRPDTGLSPADVERLNRDFIIVEHLEPAGGAAALLCDALGWLAPLLREADWPLLYLDHPAGAAFVAAEAAAGQSHPHDLRADLSPEGRLLSLRLGEMIATSPLMPEFLAVLRGRPVEDATFAALLHDAFAWTSA
ncbi:hypothetical protein D2N39_18385 [Gemmobacter lutimaris]|uniref:Uncharacterized protein n=1 Tax=Gemmobacter lutimaris TaxID=2306023 RepID=A0A398BKY3_9RHOB|nr:hypothetical protein [Gemmobacter lutimaris]RID90334.1 hypothetical protein D2N39_18385 [Gemmobacter lutimaris]